MNSIAKRVKARIKTIPGMGPLSVSLWRLIKDFKKTYKNVREELAASSHNIKQNRQEAEPARNYSELTIEQIQQAMDKWYAEGNAYKHEKLWDKIRLEERNNRCLALISPTDGKRILEIGCGIRGITPYISTCAEYVGIDLSKEAISKATRQFSGKPGFSFAVMDAQDLKFPDCSFDIIVAQEVIEHLPCIERAFGEIYRVLRPGGQVVITSPNRNSLHLRVNRMLGYKDFTCSFDHIKELTFEEAEKMLLEVGLKITHTSGTFLKPYWGIPGIDEHVRHLTDNDPTMVDMLKELGQLCGPKFAFCYVIKGEKPNNR
ncbi:MAG: class I SAM-dependent methyltransferase [Phycisphaerae bacterium]